MLERLGVPFTTLPPKLGERARRNESPASLAGRLAEAKALWGADNLDSVQRLDGATRTANARGTGHRVLVIGSDQTAELDGKLLRKPGDARTASAQLARASGQEMRFHTGIALFNVGTQSLRVAVEPCSVVFRPLSESDIARYVERERPFAQVGAFKSESLGISLFEQFVGSDPTALVGLPLIRLVEFLRAEGMNIP